MTFQNWFRLKNTKKKNLVCFSFFSSKLQQFISDINDFYCFYLTLSLYSICHFFFIQHYNGFLKFLSIFYWQIMMVRFFLKKIFQIIFYKTNDETYWWQTILPIMLFFVLFAFIQNNKESKRLLLYCLRTVKPQQQHFFSFLTDQIDSKQMEFKLMSKKSQKKLAAFLTVFKNQKSRFISSA